MGVLGVGGGGRIDKKVLFNKSINKLIYIHKKLVYDCDWERICI